MIDFLKAELPDPFGFRIDGGSVVKVDHGGNIEWTTPCKRRVEGSWTNSVHCRNLLADRTVGVGLGIIKRSGFEIDGNPAKFLNGHNLFGSADAVQLARDTVAKIAGALELPPIPADYDPGEGTVSRIDLTASWLVDRESDVIPFLDAMRETVFCPYRGKGVNASADPGTLYYGYASKGKRAKNWQLKLYAKGRELAKRPLPDKCYNIPGLLDEVNRTVRVELTLRTQELKRLGLQRVKDWNEETCARVWRDYVNKLDFTEATMANAMDFAGHLKARHLDALASWEAGNDLRVGRSDATFYRLRAELRQLCGVDIGNPVPKSNVIPLRRVIEAKPALKPHWADDLTEALRAA